MEIPNRTEGKFNKDAGMAEFYKFYKENYVPKKNSVYDVSESKYRAILSDFNQIVAEKLVKENLEFDMPCRLGVLALRKYKKKPKKNKDGKYDYRLPVDWKSTKKLWRDDPEAYKERKLVKYLNRNTNGYIFRIIYYKKKANYKNHSVYSFKPVRGLKKLIKSQVDKGKIDCYEI